MTDLQRIHLIAGFSGADVRTVRRFLNGERTNGANLRARLTEAVRKADAIASAERRTDNGTGPQHGDSAAA